MTEVVLRVTDDPTNKGIRTSFDVDSAAIQYFDYLKKDDIIPGVTYLRNADPNAKATHINERIISVGDVFFSLPDPTNPQDNIELRIIKAEAIATEPDEVTQATHTLLKLLCEIPMAYLEQFLIKGQIKYIRT